MPHPEVPAGRDHALPCTTNGTACARRAVADGVYGTMFRSREAGTTTTRAAPKVTARLSRARFGGCCPSPARPGGTRGGTAASTAAVPRFTGAAAARQPTMRGAARWGTGASGERRGMHYRWQGTAVVGGEARSCVYGDTGASLQGCLASKIAVTCWWRRIPGDGRRRRGGAAIHRADRLARFPEYGDPGRLRAETRRTVTTGGDRIAAAVQVQVRTVPLARWPWVGVPGSFRRIRRSPARRCPRSRVLSDGWRSRTGCCWPPLLAGLLTWVCGALLPVGARSWRTLPFWYSRSAQSTSWARLLVKAACQSVLSWHWPGRACGTSAQKAGAGRRPGRQQYFSCSTGRPLADGHGLGAARAGTAAGALGRVRRLADREHASPAGSASCSFCTEPSLHRCTACGRFE